MNQIGSPEFRQYCVEQMKEPYEDRENFFQRYLDGEDFNEQKLMNMGYDHWEARNINYFLESGDTTMFTLK
jgi:hypothetical protein